MRCDIGDPIILRCVFKKREGTSPNSPLEPFSPAKVVCTVEKPGGETITLDAKAEAGEDAEKGAFVATVTPDVAGTWEYAFDGFDEDGPAGSEEGQFAVRKRKVPRD